MTRLEFDPEMDNLAKALEIVEQLNNEGYDGDHIDKVEEAIEDYGYYLTIKNGRWSVATEEYE